jgi:hypothetical protein
MLETPWQKAMVAAKREHRDLPNEGWEYLGERGGNLWEIYRGARYGQRIVEARAAADGMGVWVKIARPSPPSIEAPEPRI